jgi:AAA+ superfamily predicted ATPase
MKRSASDCRDPHACESDTTKENAMSEEMEAMQSFESSSMPSLVSTTRRAAMLEATRLCDIVGHENAKLRIGEVLMSISPRFSRYMTGIRALPASILLSGPPGCGKVRDPRFAGAHDHTTLAQRSARMAHSQISSLSRSP